MFPNTTIIQNTTNNYLPAFQKFNPALYLFILLFIIISLIVLPFVHIAIGVTSQGIIRPLSERTEVKPIISGIIDSLYYREGSFINKGSVLLRLKDPVTKSKKLFNNYQITQRKAYISDLKLLTAGIPDEQLLKKIQTAVYKQQLSRYLHQKTDQEATLKKATKELATNTTLLKGKVITNKEFFDTQVQFDKADAATKAFNVEQQSTWQQDLARYQLELSQYTEEANQVNTDASYYEVKAPISGTIQGISTRYTGSLLQANEVVCNISPNGSLVAECYVTTKDIGLIKPRQKVRFQIEAFDYNYFGVLTGKVSSIDNDFTVINNNTVIKVRCLFDNEQLHLKNGYTGHLQKGLTFQARFIIGERTLWQLLWDKMDDWLNPAAPKGTT
jgi:HlyD family secretion protein